MGRANSDPQYIIFTCESVGTANGSNSSQLFGSIGTHTRPENSQDIYEHDSVSIGVINIYSRINGKGPVLGWTQKGALSKWFICFETSKSIRG